MNKFFKFHVFEIFVLGLVTLVIQVGFYFYQHKGPDYPMQDPDCYMRLLRVEEWRRTGDWFSSIISSSNAPYGETLHWTRLFDVILLAGAKLLQPFLGFHKALEIFGIGVSPLLQLASVFALAWAVAPWFDRQNRLRLIILFLLQPAAFTPFFAGRPDHHSLLIFLFILEMGCFLRILREEKPIFSYALGFLFSLSMWVNIESLTVIAVCLGTLGIFWLKNEKNAAEHFFAVASSLFFCSVIFLLLDKPFSNFTVAEYDRISIAHIFIFALFALWGMVICRWKFSTSLLSRFIFAVVSCAGIAAATFFVFPKFFHGPYADVDPRAMEVWLKGVKEVQPLWKVGSQEFFRILIWIGPAFVCLPFVIQKLKTEKEGSFWIFTSVGLMVFLPLALYQIRWSYYAIVFLLIPFTALLDQTIQWLEKKLRPPWFAVARAWTMIIFAIGFLTAGLCLMLSEPEKPSSPGASVAEMCDFLNKNHFSPRERIATFVDIAPEIIYRTQNEMIGSPYHRNNEGILFIHDMMSAKTDEEARKLVHERRITLILIEMNSHYAGIYREKEDSFCRRLMDGKIPDWLQVAPMTGNVSNNFKLFRVN